MYQRAEAIGSKSTNFKETEVESRKIEGILVRNSEFLLVYEAIARRS
jgi:hypothetical protein